MARHSPLIVGVIVLALASAALAEGLVTVRVGEQDSCSITGVTTVAAEGKAGTIKFDLAKLPAGAKVSKAVLRMWVDLGKQGAAFGAKRWDDPAFAGFNVWQVGAASRGVGETPATQDRPLATCYPFVYAPVACFEWDVTPAVAAWLAKGEANQGLRTDWPIPGNAAEPAWQRPYLQITYAGQDPGRPKQPTELRAVYRAGQVFLTWKQPLAAGAFFDQTFRVYSSEQPITAANLDKATLAGEIHRLSQLNYRRTTFSVDGRGSYAGYQHLTSYLGVEKTKDMTEAQYRQALLEDPQPVQLRHRRHLGRQA